ncbi:MAG: SPOR domain-containing protein [Chitinophagaceae bacterium]|nr:SPOR domain-containing protein [Chitinophagaceae bacterium]
MKKIAAIILLGFIGITVNAQSTAVADSVNRGKLTVIKDSRLDELAKKEATFNEALALATKLGKGYRLIVLSTNDRPLAMKVRAQLLQRYPDQKVYMSFQPPYIKLKFGNYVEKSEAEAMRKEILKNKIILGNIYIVPEKIEIKPDKNKEGDQ